MAEHELPTAYVPSAPQPPDTDALRARIPGWGVDIDPADRPSVPKERFDPEASGAQWTFPERQEERWPRERSVEHAFVTPVFGTACPPKGLSGMIRKYAYRRFSEGRAAHWLLLLGADRVDAVESHLRSFVSGRPDNPVTETGVRAEFTHNGPAERAKSTRVDKSHQWLDPILVGAPWLLALGAGLGVAIRTVSKRTVSKGLARRR
ncbi:hypothetical protein HF877_05700 [Rhodococcus sp. BL-253-APC-6A1W]|uniref:hypothetical protein n=1 Tax=Rhodococcus sp. BL-253-APC-6A1W TaxID=2725307 RepID=UPI00146EECBF|nr:hypothetical protein [Rhodococcus sp. BL-253-APC-6A1W]NMD94897.1 hypothetical protein [Rhodococcus sp. BL-253-APC-6A1W]